MKYICMLHCRLKINRNRSTSLLYLHHPNLSVWSISARSHPQDVAVDKGTKPCQGICAQPELAKHQNS